MQGKHNQFPSAFASCLTSLTRYQGHDRKKNTKATFVEQKQESLVHPLHIQVYCCTIYL